MHRHSGPKCYITFSVGSEHCRVQILSKSKLLVQEYMPSNIGGRGGHVTGEQLPSCHVPSSKHSNLRNFLKKTRHYYEGRVLCRQLYSIMPEPLLCLCISGLHSRRDSSPKNENLHLVTLMEFKVFMEVNAP